MSYFDEGGTLPPPFNIVPSPKSVWYLCVWTHNRLCGRDHPSPDDPRKHENLKEFTVKHLQTCTVNIVYSVQTFTTFPQAVSFCCVISENDVHVHTLSCDWFSSHHCPVLLFPYNNQTGSLPVYVMESFRMVLGLSVFGPAGMLLTRGCIFWLFSFQLK